MISEFNQLMEIALEEAEKASILGEVPVGSIVVLNKSVIGKGYNQCISLEDPSAHAEIIALRAAAKEIGNYRMPDAILLSTLEPCPMCYGAMVHARIKKLVFGAHDFKTGVCGSSINLISKPCFNHRIEIVEGILESKCSKILIDFFQEKR